jgi:hypothetical protein
MWDWIRRTKEMHDEFEVDGLEAVKRWQGRAVELYTPTLAKIAAILKRRGE